MDQCTENYECLVINNNAKSNKLEDQGILIIKAVVPKDFTVGSSSFWGHHKDNYKKNDTVQDTSFNKNEVKKEKGPKIKVKNYY